MENVVLGLLLIQSLTLYELNQAFKQGISLFYSASYGSLQTAVKNLLAKGFVVFEEKVDRGRNKKVYSITPQGRTAFMQWMLAEVPANKVEITALSKIFFLGQVPEIAQKKRILQDILAKIQAVHADLTRLKDEISRYDISPAGQETYKYQLKTLDYGIQNFAVAVEWAAEMLEELESPPAD